jgi:hypothetical protein
MSVQGLPEAYCTVAYADSVLGEQLPWDSAETADKEAALQWGRVYIDDNYSCAFDPNNVPESIQTANAILGNYHLTAPLYDSSKVEGEQSERGLTGNKVKAGSVESDKSYDPYAAMAKLDAYPDVTAILGTGGVCQYNGTNTKSLVRG